MRVKRRIPLKDNEKKTFGQFIERLRRINRLTQEELAFRSGISVEALSLIERDRSTPQFGTFIKIAINLKFHPWELLKEVGDRGLLKQLLDESNYQEQVKEYLETYKINKDQ
jgi:transcriptional regulator with XRE-family HTH domain